ncbi:hypothetical protein PM082_013664 [Marasmius tenuissimus]|nr:hypothetical protein PM082_013664 [Marasmius tenuissimus]
MYVPLLSDLERVQVAGQQVMVDYEKAAINIVLLPPTVKGVIGFPTATLTIMYYFHGLYTVLAMACVYLLHRNRSENKRFYIGCSSALFVICTLMVINTTIQRTRESSVMFSAVEAHDFKSLQQYAFEDRLKFGYYIPGFLLPGLANAVAEAMLIHRCYMVWGHSKVVASPLAFFSVMGTILYIITAILVSLCLRDVDIESKLRLSVLAGQFDFAGAVTSTIVNVTVAGLTAWKIWRMTEMSRTMQPRQGTGKGSKNKFSNVIRIILESAALYPLMASVQLALLNGFKDNGQLAPFDLSPVVVISAGISSSMALVRAQFAKMSRSTVSFGEGAVSDMRFELNIAESGTSSHSAIDIRNNTAEAGSASSKNLEVRARRSSLVSPDPN